MSEIVLKRRAPLGTARYALETLERQEVKAGRHPLLIHEALEALERAERELAEAREQGRQEERERAKRIATECLADAPFHLRDADLGQPYALSVVTEIRRRLEAAE